jgi:carboxymethylenebutenolidase
MSGITPRTIRISKPALRSTDPSPIGATQRRKSAIDLAPEIKEPVLGLYGAEDTGIKVEQINEMEAALKADGKTAEFHIYPGAPHGFVADYRSSYRKDAAEDAWNRMAGWFKKYGVLS